MAVPMSPAHMVTEAEPYLCTSGLARTENVANERAVIRTSSGPMIEPPDARFKSGADRINVPAMPTPMANASLFPIFSFSSKVESMAMKIGPNEVKNAATPDETVFSAKLSDKWYAGTFSREIAISLGRSRLSSFILGFKRKGAIAKKPADATSHLSKVRFMGESSKSALRIATKAMPQIRLRTRRTP